MKKAVHFFILLLFVSPLFLLAQKKINTRAADFTKLPVIFDSYIQKAIPDWKIPGLSIVVVKNSKVVFKKAYGVQDLSTKTPYTINTLSTCASTTKAMTAVCMGMLVDEGKIKWTDIVSDILPEFKLSDPYATAEITIKDLFTHNTGLGNADLLWVLGYSRSEILHRMQFVPTSYSLRSSYTYQNLMYLVAGEVIKKITGKSWDEFITERIFLPLGMNNTYADYSKIPSTNFKTTPHFKDSDDRDSVKPITYLAYDNIGPAGGVWSCADDISKWLIFLLDSTKINGTPLLKKETFNNLFTPAAIIPVSQFYPTMQLIKPHWTTYGLGWFQHDYRGRMVQFHTGSLAGLTAICGMIPDDNVAVYIFGNLDHAEIRHALMYKAFDLWAFNDTSTDWSTSFLKLYNDITDSAKKREDNEMANRVKETHPSLSLKEYTGIYTNKIYGTLTVMASNDSLILQLPSSKFRLSVTHWNFDTFRGSYNYWWWGKSVVQFSLNAIGKVSALFIDGIKYDIDNEP